MEESGSGLPISLTTSHQIKQKSCNKTRHGLFVYVYV